MTRGHRASPEPCQACDEPMPPEPCCGPISPGEGSSPKAPHSRRRAPERTCTDHLPGRHLCWTVSLLLRQEYSISGVPRWLSGFRTWLCHGCGRGLISGPGTSASQKKKKKGTVFPVLLGVARIGEGVSVRGGLDQGPVFAAAIRPPKGSTCL